MEKQTKTIAVLVYTHVMHYGSLADKTTSCFEAYESYEEAIVALKEEFTSSMNERVFKHETLIDTDIDDRRDVYQAKVVYNDGHGNRHTDIFELQVIDLVTK